MKLAKLLTSPHARRFRREIVRGFALELETPEQRCIDGLEEFLAVTWTLAYELKALGTVREIVKSGPFTLAALFALILRSRGTVSIEHMAKLETIEGLLASLGANLDDSSEAARAALLAALAVAMALRASFYRQHSR